MSDRMLRVVPAWIDPLCGPSVPEGRWFTLMLAAALVAHGIIALALPRHKPARAPAPTMVSEVIDITPEPPPAPDVPVLPQPPEPPKSPSSGQARRVEQPAQPREAPAVLTQAAEPDAPLDLTDTIVTGLGSSVGGPSSARGVHGSRPGSRGETTGGGVAGGRTGGASGDRSRAATLAGGLAWNCPFPEGADHEGVNHALVTLHLRVDAAGVLRAVSVLQDPGFGFGAAAQRCARLQRFEPARAADGTKTHGEMTVRVRFSR
jgi:protein TonB